MAQIIARGRSNVVLGPGVTECALHGLQAIKGLSGATCIDLEEVTLQASIRRIRERAVAH